VRKSPDYEPGDPGKITPLVSRSRLLCDHRVLIPISLSFYYLLPPMVAALGLPKYNVIVPDIWLISLLIFGLVSYWIGCHCQPRITRYLYGSFLESHATHLTTALLFLLLTVYEFSTGGGIVSIPLALILAFCTHQIFKRELDIKTGVVMMSVSIVLILIGWVQLGGIPIFNSNIIEMAKLSPLRRLTLPLFILGALVLSLGLKEKWRKGSVIPLGIFAVGAVLFMANGSRADLFGVVFGCLLFYLFTLGRRWYRIAGLGIVLGTILIFALFPGTPGMLRQRFNFQVLRHTVLYADPIKGATHGAASLGPRQNFLGPGLIYGEGENWTFTATWFGTAYLDLGLPGIFITLFLLGMILEGIRGATIKSDAQNASIIYLATLAILLSLFQEGMDLAVMIFLTSMILGKQHQGTRNTEPETPVSNGNRPALLIAAATTLLIITFAFVVEFSLGKPVDGIETMGERQHGFNRSLKPGYYDLKISGSGTQSVRGNLGIFCQKDRLANIEFDGILWEAEVDRIDLGWIKVTGNEPKQYYFEVHLKDDPDESIGGLSFEVERSPISTLLPDSYLPLFVAIPFPIFFLYQVTEPRLRKDT
jgi:hypothetical protein